MLVVFFHGNDATLERDVLGRQQVAAQLEASGLNAILVAPQFAFDALDSSAGKILGGRRLRDAGSAKPATGLLRFTGDIRVALAVDQMRVLLIAYSGGYLPAAYAVSVGGVGQRMSRGLVPP